MLTLRSRVGRESIGVAVLVVLALICGGLIAAVVVKTRDDAAAAQREAAVYTPPPLSASSAVPRTSASSTPAASDDAVIAVVGDAFSSAAASGVTATGRWPARLARSIGARSTTIAASGSGYTASGSSGRTFVQAASQVPTTAAAVIFAGGGADLGASRLELATAATRALSAAQQRAPHARLIVVAPLAGGDADVVAALESSAMIAGAHFIDPVRDAWFATGAALNPAKLTAAQERTIASKLKSVVAASIR